MNARYGKQAVAVQFDFALIDISHSPRMNKRFRRFQIPSISPAANLCLPSGNRVH
jgi:hypothetical protein